MPQKSVNRNIAKTPTGQPTEQVEQHTEELKDEMDALLDEIDTVLEENAWVTRYVQKGGE